MNPRSEHFEWPAWVATALRLTRRLVAIAILLATLFALSELVAFRLYPERSTRFLLEGQSDGNPAWIDNQFFSYRFFPARTARAPLPVVALKTPPPGTLRVCLLGGSTAMGLPEPSFGLGRQLELMLERRYPGHPVEVVHMAVENGNSHVLREAARDLRRLKPHAVIVLAGNDEATGPYGPASGFGQWNHSYRLARAMAIFSRTRTSQLFVDGINRLFPARADLNAWKSQEPISLRGRMAPNDPRLHTVQRSFRKNLAAILREAADVSPVVIACTVPVNLRDCAPFSTSFLEDEAAAQEVRETLRAAIAAEAATNRLEAARLYSGAIRRDSSHAEALFRAARLALAERQTAEAAALFSRARDADAMRLRADSTLNAIVRDCAAKTGASLLDAEALFAIRSPQGIPGRELFLDHVHFTFDGTHLLASALLDRMEFLRAFDANPSGPIPNSEEMASELLYHPWGRVAELDALIRQHLRPPFRRQLTNAESLAKLNEEHRAWNDKAASVSPENTRAIFARRQAGRPNDAWLSARAAWYLFRAGDERQAEAAALQAFAHWPHRFDVRALLSLTRACQGQPAEKGISYIRTPSEDAGYYDVDLAISIGKALNEKQLFAEARPWLEYSLRRDAWNSQASIALAETLYRLDASADAIEWMKSAIKRNPANPLLWEELAVLYTLRGDWNLANDCFGKSEELAPYRYERLLKWAEAMFRLRQYARASRPIARYLAFMPDDPEALALKAQIDANLPSKPEPAAEPDKPKPSRRFPWE